MQQQRDQIKLNNQITDSCNIKSTNCIMSQKLTYIA